VLDPTPLVLALVADRDAGVPAAALAAGFHEAFGSAAATLAAELAGASGLDTVVLTGGVFQNVRLTEVVEAGLRGCDLHVLGHRRIPTNDGGISVGQAAVAAWAG
jgi:hydrogenase maturation protein HypF